VQSLTAREMAALRSGLPSPRKQKGEKLKQELGVKAGGCCVGWRAKGGGSPAWWQQQQQDGVVVVSAVCQAAEGGGGCKLELVVTLYS
jgi:hypothetical protein